MNICASSYVFTYALVLFWVRFFLTSVCRLIVQTKPIEIEFYFSAQLDRLNDKKNYNDKPNVHDECTDIEDRKTKIIAYID